MNKEFNLRKFVIVMLLVSIWVNASEVFRYFVFVMPGTRAFLFQVPGVAPMNWGIFAVWGTWDTILTIMVVFIYWLVAERFGHGLKSVLIASTASWTFFFVLFWVAMVNMALSSVTLPLIALPLAWLELFVASLISAKLFARA
ncbi:MAG TPA: hypothetical protein VMI53_00065 [Opitutaceae bacterium]|nr:hypothetical protein [Opitutaceae bacterium]